MEIQAKKLTLLGITFAFCGVLSLFAAVILPGSAQTTTLRSPEVHSDNRVTFRLRAPNAKEVILAREGAPRLPMQKDEQGVWSVTTDPLQPGKSAAFRVSIPAANALAYRYTIVD